MIRSAAVPHLSTADGSIYTVTRTGADTTTPLDGYAVTGVNPDTGVALSNCPLAGTSLRTRRKCHR